MNPLDFVTFWLSLAFGRAVQFACGEEEEKAFLRLASLKADKLLTQYRSNHLFSEKYSPSLCWACLLKIF